MLFMDISRSDDEQINSVLIGCSCNARSIYLTTDEAHQWGTDHMNNHHPGSSKAVKQIGQPKTRKRPLQSNLLSILSDSPQSTKELSEQLPDFPANSVYIALGRMEKVGNAQRIGTKGNFKWTA